MGILEDPEAPTSPLSNSAEDMANEELLPLYSETHQTSLGSLQQPQPRATPDQVRDFLVQLLVANRGLPVDHARRIAAKWTKGTGREVASYPPLMYCDIFGFEDGWIVYKEAKLFIANENNKKFSHRHGAKIAIACLTILELAMISMVYFNTTQPVLVFLGLIIGLPGGAALVGLTCVTLFRSSPEDDIESELRSGLKEARRA